MRHTFYLAFLVVSLFSNFSFAGGGKVNLGLGYGNAEHQFSTENKYSSVGAHVDLQFRWLIFEAGLNYLTVSQLAVGERRNYVEYWGANVGFGFGRTLEIIGGVGYGKWRHADYDPLTTPSRVDYSASGPGYMAGIRLHVLQFKEISVGLSASFYRLVNASYNSKVDGVESKPLVESRGTASLAAIVFSWNAGKIAKK